MSKSINYLFRAMGALLLCAGLVFTGCTDGPLGEGVDPDGPLTWSLENVTEESATFVGRLDVPAPDLSFSKVTLCYSDAEVFNVNDALAVSTTKFDGDQKFTITVTDLKPNVKYNYCLIAEVKSEKTYSDVKDFTTEGFPDLKLEDIKTEVDVMTVTITGKIAGVEEVDISKVSVKLVWDINYSSYEYECDQISEDGYFRLVLKTKCREEPMQHNDVCECMLGIYYKSQNIDIQKVVIHTYVPTGTVRLSSVSSDSAEFTGVIDDFAELSQCLHQVGVWYSLDPNVDPSSAKKTQGTLNDDGTFTVTLNDLMPGRRYYYGLVILHNGPAFGDIQEFTTLQFETPSGYTDLASASSANCYIVSQSGSYCFPAVRGNASSDWLSQTEEACVLWETFGTSTPPSVGDLIKSVSYKDGHIAFQTSDTFKEGNAVIAAKDVSGTILWSWHIWFTDQPQGQVYYNNAGTMMDRNLGATSATPGDVGALGLLYQWGRKDPFLGGSSIDDDIEAESTIAWPSAVATSSSCGTVSYVTANPTVYVYGTSSMDYDWHYSSRDNTLWTTSSSAKSIYDPCPSGWRVPDGGITGVWSNAVGSGTSIPYSPFDKGVNFNYFFGSYSSIWYPASGWRNGHNGSLYNVGDYCDYWSASPHRTGAHILHYGPGSSPNYYRAQGRSVRCIQE